MLGEHVKKKLKIMDLNAHIDTEAFKDYYFIENRRVFLRLMGCSQEIVKEDYSNIGLMQRDYQVT